MGRGTGDGAAPFLCVLGRAERTVSHAVQPRFPWCIISHAGLMLPYSPCLTVVFSLYYNAREGFGNRLLVVCNGNGTETLFRSPWFVIGAAGGSQMPSAGTANALLFENQSFPKPMSGVLEAFMVALGESYSRVSEGMQIRSYKGRMEMEVWTNVNENGRFVHFLGCCRTFVNEKEYICVSFAEMWTCVECLFLKIANLTYMSNR